MLARSEDEFDLYQVMSWMYYPSRVRSKWHGICLRLCLCYFNVCSYLLCRKWILREEEKRPEIQTESRAWLRKPSCQHGFWKMKRRSELKTFLDYLSVLNWGYHCSGFIFNFICSRSKGWLTKRRRINYLEEDRDRERRLIILTLLQRNNGSR